MAAVFVTVSAAALVAWFTVPVTAEGVGGWTAGELASGAGAGPGEAGGVLAGGTTVSTVSTKGAVASLTGSVRAPNGSALATEAQGSDAHPNRTHVASTKMKLRGLISLRR
ncbi:MAG TPA: hypothetical protein VGI73_15295 [Solirubrobacterales bacterium]